MGYTLIIPPALDEKLKKLKKKDKQIHERVFKKLDEIMENPESVGHPKSDVFKNSRGIHIGPYVLIWAVRDNNVTIVRFEHHDHAYKRN